MHTYSVQIKNQIIYFASDHHGVAEEAKKERWTHITPTHDSIVFESTNRTEEPLHMNTGDKTVLKKKGPVL